MSKVKIALGVVGGLVGVVLLGAGGSFVWASSTTAAKLSAIHETHVVDFPIPPPLSEEEIWALRAELEAERVASNVPVDPAVPLPDVLAGIDLDAIARERSLARGRHLLQARIACLECHGENGGGGKMIDSPIMGKFLAPNLTSGQGSAVAAYTASDWDRAVRHGVLPGGAASVMPGMAFLSDQELGDIVFALQAMPPVDNQVGPRVIGPMMKVLIANESYLLLAEHSDPQAVHAVAPPDSADTLAFGKHLAQECAGCHRPDFKGGPVPGGPPDWPPAGDLTRADGLQSWTQQQFEDVLRKAVRPDGSPLGGPMKDMPKLAVHLSEQEIGAMYAFFQTLDGAPATP